MAGQEATTFELGLGAGFFTEEDIARSPSNFW